MLTNRPGASLGASRRMCIWVNHWHVIYVTLWLMVLGRVHYVDQLAQSTERSRTTTPTSSLTWLLIQLTIARSANRRATCI